MSRVSLLFAAVISVSLSTGCASVQLEDSPKSFDPPVTQIDAKPAPSALVSGSKPEVETVQKRLIFSDHRQGLDINALAAPRKFNVQTLQLNFIEAPAADIVRTLINDALGETVAIAAGSDVLLTLNSPQPVPTDEALLTLEETLRTAGLSLIEQKNGFVLTQLDQSSNGQSLDGRRFGNVSDVVLVAHTVPSALVNLVEPFNKFGVRATANDREGVIMLEGQRAYVADFADILRQFDLPSLSAQHYGMFRLVHSNASEIAEEVRRLLDTTAGANKAVLIPIQRLNRLFIMTPSEAQFHAATMWIEQLDQPAQDDERRLYYYVVENAPADVIAQQLEAVFLGRASRRDPDTARGDPSLSGNAPNAPSFNVDRLSIVPDKLNNALIIRATGDEYRDLSNLIRRMDELPPQVLIEATIAEVTLTDELQYGVRWFFQDNKLGLSYPFQAATNGSLPVFASDAQRVSASYIDGLSAGIAIDTLASVTDVSVISAPSIMVQNNQTANLQVGDQIPVVTQSNEGIVSGDAIVSSSTVQFRDTGVILTVKPRINASDTIVLEVEQEVSNTVETVTSGIDSPTIQQRQFSSTVAVRDGGTAILGGLIRESTRDNESGIPVLKDAPILGHLFKSTDQNTTRTELIIFLTPKIIRNDRDISEVVSLFKRQLTALPERLDVFDTK